MPFLTKPALKGQNKLCCAQLIHAPGQWDRLCLMKRESKKEQPIHPPRSAISKWRNTCRRNKFDASTAFGAIHAKGRNDAPVLEEQAAEKALLRERERATNCCPAYDQNRHISLLLNVKPADERRLAGRNSSVCVSKS